MSVGFMSFEDLMHLDKLHRRSIYPLELVKTVIKAFTEPDEGMPPRKRHRLYYDLRPIIVYTAIEIDGKYLPLNRDYKPIGLTSGDWVNYSEFPFLLIEKSMIDTPELEENGVLPKRFYLFNDGNTPIDRKNQLQWANLAAKVFRLQHN
jgi:hypothetical protein